MSTKTEVQEVEVSGVTMDVRPATRDWDDGQMNDFIAFAS
jgi:hypothetical protein